MISNEENVLKLSMISKISALRTKELLRHSSLRIDNFFLIFNCLGGKSRLGALARSQKQLFIDKMIDQ